ncbi:hypothetical protein DN752_00995 [Echinicola strongylocentroti]|uniref:Uncharacterized protein n=1 Tax=Echinicola strongylocentroti TaxID=1795355 RepID=A0A2Z4IDD1_9BACT|nr:DUF6660 family protein [Echinicola strongylocentroti]AWW28820.1 hypothetical protein DN752_00995 [Echinicola strongylocentroti]
MKVIQVILSYYLLLLVVFPCADEHKNETLVQKESVVLSQGSDHQHDGDADHCSPLCVCHCCHIHYVIAEAATIDFLKEFTAVYSTPIEDFDGDWVFDFLKPPKITSPLNLVG